MADACQDRLTRFAETLPACSGAALVVTQHFVGTLRKRRAVPHSMLATRLAKWRGLSAVECEHIATCLDVIQVAIDVTDNVADFERDAQKQGHYTYPKDLLPTIASLPALFVGEVLLTLNQEFEHGGAAARQLMNVLSKMAEGQSLEGEERLRLISGEQGRLLCLPLWLTPASAEETASFERWAFALGDTWERLEIAKEIDSPMTRARYRNASMRLQRLWPRYAPFGLGQPLGPDAFGTAAYF